MNREWQDFSDEKLLKLRFRDLDITWKGSTIEPLVLQFFEELKALGFEHFRPRIYLGDEWFSPEGTCAISVPFFLAHPRLLELEKTMMLEAEGEKEESFLQLIRHESGHCLDHAYRVSRTKAFREVFGSPRKDYDPDHFRPQLYSKRYVRHLDHFYAQAHPDEDFAETFAVWMTPGSHWEQDYKEWPRAIRKLRFVDQLAKRIRSRRPKQDQGGLLSDVRKMRTTLGAYYQRKKKHYAHDFPTFFDDDLSLIFAPPDSGARRKAAVFIRSNRKRIVKIVSRWSGEKKYSISDLLKKLSLRAKALDLRVADEDLETVMEISSYVASLAMHYRFTGKYKEGKKTP